ncbi:hypothetical protein LCGC14_0434710 [marine sediment metagenome]|uniref:Uncharacterized protein n=1 Tax=marine sediment metagenome TaxID=412755 RepID=A0A0F9ST85_9ZZZZ
MWQEFLTMIRHPFFWGDFITVGYIMVRLIHARM